MAGYSASVDFPSAVLWRDLAEAFPDAPVLLSTRQSAEAWWRSADATILATARRHLAEGSDDPFAAGWHAMLRDTEIPHTNTTQQFRAGAGLDEPTDP